MTKARVKSKTGLNLRAKPNGEKLFVLAHNQEVELLEEVRFFRVLADDGRIGYVHGDYIESYPEAEIDRQTDSLEAAFPSQLFELVEYSAENFIGQKAMVDKDFVASLNRLNLYAGNCQLKIWVTSSTRCINEQVNGAIVPPASYSCHYVGHAIDMNIQYDGILFNSKKLARSQFNQLPAAILNFIDAIRQDKELRWGGDFNTEDPVHIDDNLFKREELIYTAKLYTRLDQLNTQLA